MEINSVNSANGIGAYTANSLNSGKSQLEDQNKASARSDVSQLDAKAAQQAFEVNISQRAQALSSSSNGTTGQQGAETQSTANPQATGATQAPDSGQGMAARQQASQIVNIVA